MEIETDQLWTQMTRPLQAFIRRRVRDEHLADDLVQEVLLKVQKNLDSAPEGQKLAAWMFQIARNTITDHYRSPRSRRGADLDAVPEPAAEETEEDATAELSGCLRPMIAKLPEPYRQALELTEYEGLTQQQLADRLGLSLPGAKSRVQRARQQLREMFVDCCAVQTDRSGRVVDHHRTDKSDQYCGEAPGSCCDPARDAQEG